jgi:Beta-galactosidase
MRWMNTKLITFAERVPLVRRAQEMNNFRWFVSIICATLFGVLFLSDAARAEADPRDSDSPYGVLNFLSWDHEWNNHFYGSRDKMEKSVALMKEAGIHFVRMDFYWADLEPQKGHFDFERYDGIVDLLKKNDIQVLALLHYNAAWEPQWNTPPDTALYVKYARTTVRHFKSRIKYWEIWNEPDSRIYWSPQDDMKTYTLLLKESYQALKEEDPTCKVVLGGLTEGGPFALRSIYRLGGGPFFDIVNIHPFANPLAPNAIKQVRGIYLSTMKVMEQFGDGSKPIWFTEIGCPGVRTNSGPAWWDGPNPTEEEQARWVSAVYEEALRWKGVQKVFWAFFRDTDDHFKNGIDFFGLVRNDFSKKPSYEAYKAAAHAPKK